MADTIRETDSYVESMTKEEAEAFYSFIDYMVELYRKYGHKHEEADKQESV